MDMGQHVTQWRAMLCLAFATEVLALTPSRPISDYHKKYWQTEQNLPGNEVWAIGYAPDGRFLVGTATGLATFDGIRFLAPTIDSPIQLSKERIHTFLTTRDNSLWIATHDHGVHRYREGHTRAYTIPAELGRVRWFLEDSGTLWASTDNALVRFDGERFVRVPNVTGSRHWYSLAGDGQGAIWAVTGAGLSRISNGQATPVLDNRSVGTVLSVARGRDGAVWAGTTQGLFRLPEAKKLPGVTGLVVGILSDSAGQIWVATWAWFCPRKSLSSGGPAEGYPRLRAIGSLSIAIMETADELQQREGCLR